jgi:hypothetical protein
MIFLILIGILLVVVVALFVRIVLTNPKVDEFAKDYCDFTPKCKDKSCESKSCESKSYKCESEDLPDIESPGNGKVKEGEGI